MRNAIKIVVLIGGAGGTPVGTATLEIAWDEGDFMAWDEGDFIAWD